ncbi:MAG: LysR family transcriptional regulator [Alphaproteobacteria bacterium]|nr:LysR family transcriptional regulator [Alphaproteobacteria bacterium]
MKHNNLENFYNFCTIVDAGSLQAASNKLGIPAPTLSRRLKNLEQDLGVKLLNRSAHHLHLTTEGEAYYNQLSPNFKQLDQGLGILNNDEGTLEGDIILSVPEGMLNICVNAWAAEFLQKWPKVNILLEKTQTIHDFEANKIDVAVKLEAKGPNDWKMKKIFTNEKWLVASTDYMSSRTMPTHPDQLAEYDIITNDDNQNWQFIIAGKIVNYKFKPRYKPYNLFHALEAGLMGLGISHYPRFLVETYVNQGKMVRLLPTYTTEEAAVYMFYQDKSLLSKRVRTFIDFLNQKTSKPEDIFLKYKR